MLIVKYLTDKDFERFIPMDKQKEDFVFLASALYKKPKLKGFVFQDENKTPVLIIGLHEKWQGVYDSYTVFSQAWKPMYFKTVVKKVKKYIDKISCDRIEHMVKCDSQQSCKLAEFFGFNYVATLKKYCNGVDYKLYEIVK